MEGWMRRSEGGLYGILMAISSFELIAQMVDYMGGDAIGIVRAGD